MSTIEQQYEQHEARQLGAEAENLLQLAEDLQDRCERYDRHRIVSIFGATGGAFVMAALSVYGFENLQASHTVAAILIAAMGTISAFLVAAFGIVLHKRSIDLYRRDNRAFHAVVNMLREIEHAIAEQEGTSAMEQAAFKIRLARFDIGD